MHRIASSASEYNTKLSAYKKRTLSGMSYKIKEHFTHSKINLSPAHILGNIRKKDSRRTLENVLTQYVLVVTYYK